MAKNRMSVSLPDALYKRLQAEKKRRPHMTGNAIIVEALLAQLAIEAQAAARKA